jgi:glutathione S-transferase
LVEKGYKPEEYEIKEIDICKFSTFTRRVGETYMPLCPVTAENFDPEYLNINPMGTVPALASPALPSPLTSSTDVLRWLDANSSNGETLTPADPALRQRMHAIMDAVHSSELGTDLILLHARDEAEMAAKQAHPIWPGFLAARQARLEREFAAHPAHPFFAAKMAENAGTHGLYHTKVGEGSAHEAFFTESRQMYEAFARGVAELDALLVLPYAAGEDVSEADLHAAPWLAHAMWGAGGDPAAIDDFGPLEGLVGKTVPEFRVGGRLREWWAAFTKRESFKAVFPELH